MLCFSLLGMPIKKISCNVAHFLRMVFSDPEQFLSLFSANFLTFDGTKFCDSKGVMQHGTSSLLLLDLLQTLPLSLGGKIYAMLVHCKL